jgi:polyisoprenoid-binding protein YceI
VSSHRRRGRSWLRWVLVAAAAVVVLAVGVPFAYIHFIEGQATADTPLAGPWTVTTGSRAGYRVNEVLAGQKNIAVGRTSSVAGHLTLSRAAVTAGTFTVRMATIRSDRSQRDAQFDGRQPAIGASASASGTRMPGSASSGRFMIARSTPASR